VEVNRADSEKHIEHRLRLAVTQWPIDFAIRALHNSNFKEK
jgi:hypothetical protein